MDAPAFITRTTASLARPAPLHSTRHVFISSDRDPRCNVRGLFIFITLKSGAVKNNEISTSQVGQCMQPAARCVNISKLGRPGDRFGDNIFMCGLWIAIICPEYGDAMS